MAALLVGFRWRQLGHQLARNTWMVVTLALVGLWALGALAGLTLGLATLRVAAPDLATTLLVVAGSILVVGWWLGAIITGADESLAPERFALLPVRARTLLPGLVLASATGVGGIASALALLLMLVGWSVSWAAAIAAVVLVPVALATCVLGARVVSGLLARWLAGRRARDVIVIVTVLLVACSGMLLQLVLGAITTLDTAATGILTLSQVLAWTPIGAVFGVPAAIVEGAWLVALGRLVVALATLVLLWLAAQSMLAARLVAPITSSGGGRVRSGRLLDRMLPATPAGAIAARSLRYRRRDPRHIVNVLMLVVLPFILVGVNLMQSFQGEATTFSTATILVPAIVSILVASIVQMDVAYDHDAVALHVLTGVPGSSDRAGRLLGVGIIAVPLIVLTCVVCTLLAGDWALLPASLGAALGLSLVAAGTGAWLGAYLPGRAPAPGANPLGRGSSGGVQSWIAMLAFIPALLVLGGPAFAFAIVALVADPVWGWVSLAAGVVIGVAAVWVGIVQGGKALERRWPEVLAAITSES